MIKNMYNFLKNRDNYMYSTLEFYPTLVLVVVLSQRTGIKKLPFSPRRCLADWRIGIGQWQEMCINSSISGVSSSSIAEEH